MAEVGRPDRRRLVCPGSRNTFLHVRTTEYSSKIAAARHAAVDGIAWIP